MSIQQVRGIIPAWLMLGILAACLLVTFAALVFSASAVVTANDALRIAEQTAWAVDEMGAVNR